ncbi:hypothetical protein P8C59_007802 [Phyllachora maydis]|uniref:Bromodomain associated domain-containing protein n=1 Tax=Phyllachora maydis TaxID=1825666 RepID=A0AAD9I964_9PEZI|nr:hypothetical protein P8C59_007802 [Phyllachora maydis]
MAPPPTVFHALLRPAVLQILRAAGYSHTRAPVLDSLTDLAVRYFFRLCQVTAACAAQSGASEDGTPDLADVRLALQFVGALLPEKLQQEQEFFGVEDTRGTDEFVAWAEGAVNREIRRVALDGNEEAMDWLDALKKKHSKTDDDTKYMGTLLGRPVEHGDVTVEGGECPTIAMWEEKLKAAARRSPEVVEGRRRQSSETPSSGLSSLGDGTIVDEMEFE